VRQMRSVVLVSPPDLQLQLLHAGGTTCKDVVGGKACEAYARRPGETLHLTSDCAIGFQQLQLPVQADQHARMLLVVVGLSRHN
jgi:hypothetical protein